MQTLSKNYENILRLGNVDIFLVHVNLRNNHCQRESGFLNAFCTKYTGKISENFLIWVFVYQSVAPSPGFQSAWDEMKDKVNLIHAISL